MPWPSLPETLKGDFDMARDQIPEKIFREYDIRGVVDKELTEKNVELIGRAFASELIESGAKAICCGRDGRIHSERLQRAFEKGALDAGIDVLDVGLCPTPVLYFAVHNLQVQGGVEITGSHNPPEFNGIKMCIGKSTIFGQQIKALYQRITSNNFLKGHGAYKKIEIIDDYLKYLNENIKVSSSIKGVIDCGNGTTAVVAPMAFKQAGIVTESLFCTVDGTFPNHHPDPTVLENLQDLRNKVLETGADVGFAFDGDGDRVGVVDEKGQVIYGDRLLVLLARKLLEKNPGATVIGEVKCSHVLYQDIEKHGGKPIMWKTGHSLIKQKMKETGALLAGEMSGHIFFADRFFGYDDGIYAALRICEILSQESLPMSELLADLPKTHSTPEIRFDCPDDIKFQLVDSFKKVITDQNLKVIDIDGIRIDFGFGWGLLRASNTQPVLVMRFEAETEKGLEEIKNFFQKGLQEAMSQLEKTA